MKSGESAIAWISNSVLGRDDVGDVPNNVDDSDNDFGFSAPRRVFDSFFSALLFSREYVVLTVDASEDDVVVVVESSDNDFSILLSNDFLKDEDFFFLPRLDYFFSFEEDCLDGRSSESLVKLSRTTFLPSPPPPAATSAVYSALDSDDGFGMVASSFFSLSLSTNVKEPFNEPGINQSIEVSCTRINHNQDSSQTPNCRISPHV
jgi:hypothetical protein